jgi:triacylglycerol lipase
VLERRLRAAGWPRLIAIDYRSVAGDIDVAARILGDVVATHRRASGSTRVLLVAHGIGGLVCRVYLRAAAARAAVTKLVTLATAHQGSKLFALSLDPMLAALRDGSMLLGDLAADRPTLPGLDVIAIAASFDPFVVPATRAHLPGASNIVVEGVGHFGMLWSARVFALVEENLRDESTGAVEEA